MEDIDPLISYGWPWWLIIVSIAVFFILCVGIVFLIRALRRRKEKIHVKTAVDPLESKWRKLEQCVSEEEFYLLASLFVREAYSLRERTTREIVQLGILRTEEIELLRRADAFNFAALHQSAMQEDRVVLKSIWERHHRADPV